MEIKSDKQAEVLSNFDADSIDMTIDDSNKQVLMHILSTGLYQDPIGSLIRENVSNNLDATVEAGSTQPVIVGIATDENYRKYFYSQDFGTGISPERMEKIVSKYAASTKRSDNKQKGYFGLGLKSSLAYADSFWIITNFDGMKYSYLMYKGETGSKIELMDQTQTDEPNGTIFKVYLKNSYNEEEIFIKKIREQLSYVENLYFNIKNFNNNYNIYKTEDWWFVPNHVDNSLHIVLDGIYYPIDFNKLGINRIDIPIALKFGLEDGLVPVPSRESIIMTPGTIEKIKDKIQVVADDIIERYNSQVSGIEDWFKYSDELEKYYKCLVIDKPDGGEIHLQINDIEKFGTKKLKAPKFTGFELKYLNSETIEDALQYAINISREWVARINRGYYSSNQHDRISLYIAMRNHYTPTITSSTPVSKVLLAYLKEKYNYYNYSSPLYIYKNSAYKIPLKRYYGQNAKRSYYELLGLSKIEKGKWRAVITEFQEFVKYMINKYVIDLDNYVIPDEWLKQRKEDLKSKRKIKEKKERGTFVIKFVGYSTRSDWGGNFTDVMDVNDNSVRKMKGLHVYDSEDNKSKLANLEAIIKPLRNSRVDVVCVAKSNLKRLTNLKNFITYDEFMKGKTRPFKVYATGVYIARELKTIKSNHALLETLKLIDENFNKLYKEIEGYSDLVRNIDNEFATSIVDYATENNLLDKGALVTLDKVKEIIDELNFVDLVEMPRIYYNDSVSKQRRDKAISFIREVWKYRKLYKKNKLVEKEVEIIVHSENNKENSIDQISTDLVTNI